MEAWINYIQQCFKLICFYTMNNEMKKNTDLI